MSTETTLPSPTEAEEKPAPGLLKSGDRAERLTFLGITATGKALCQCMCGTIGEFPPKLLGSFVKPPGQWRQRDLHLMRCSLCRETAEKLRAMR